MDFSPVNKKNGEKGALNQKSKVKDTEIL